MTLDTDLDTTIRSFPRTKTVQARVSKAPTDGTGRFVALASTFGPPPDTMGDIISVGAFDETIARASVERPGRLFPIWWQHAYQDPANAVGVITSAVATPQGLIVEGQLAIDSSEKAMNVYGGLLSGAISQWSISYGIMSEHAATWGGEPVNYLDRLELLEISAVWSGANRFTRTLSVKQAPSVPAELAAIKRRVAAVLGPSEPTSVEAVRARIDSVMGSPARKPIDAGAVAAFIAEQHAERQAEETAKKRQRELADELAFRARAMSGRTLEENFALEAEHDAERAQREADEFARRAAEREAERLQAEAVDAARRAATTADPFVFTP